MNRSRLRQKFCLFLVGALLLITAHRLPAPIQEVPQSPTPSPEQSAKPKPKRTITPKVPSKSSEELKRASIAASPIPRIQTAPSHTRFEGTWIGTANIPGIGDVTFTFIINAEGTQEHENSSQFGLLARRARCDGKTMTWHHGSGTTTFTPNPDGKTALLVGSDPFVGHWSGTFRRTSP